MIPSVVCYKRKFPDFKMCQFIGAFKKDLKSTRNTSSKILKTWYQAWFHGWGVVRGWLGGG